MSDAPKRVLVVDDDELLRDFYRRLLGSQGYVPVCASNGAEAIDILTTAGESFDLAVIDLLLPVRTGWELIEHIKGAKELADLPIIAITGLSFSLEEFEKIKNSCDAVFLKGDFEITKFNETIAGLLSD